MTITKPEYWQLASAYYAARDSLDAIISILHVTADEDYKIKVMTDVLQTLPKLKPIDLFILKEKEAGENLNVDNW